MHRIDSSTATPDSRFTEGDPTIPVPATTVTAAWLNAMQEELVAILAAAGIAPNKASNVQVLSAIIDLIADSTPLAKVGTPGLVMPDGTTIVIDATGKISTKAQSMDPVGGIRFFEDEAPRAGYVPCLGTTISNFSTTYPDMAAYLSTPYGAARLVTLAQYNALHTATWATLADGSTVGWNGIGGVTKFVWDKAADTLKMPDLQEMFRSSTGASLGVGAVHGDGIPPIRGRWSAQANMNSVNLDGSSVAIIEGPFAYNASDIGNRMTIEDTSSNYRGAFLTFDSARAVQSAKKVQTRAWGALACAYLGQPVAS